MLRNGVENQKTFKIESNNLVRAARNRIQRLLTESAALKNEVENLRNLRSESDNIVREARDKVMDLLKNNLKKEISD